MRSALADGDSIDHFLVFSVTTRSAATDGNSMDHFLVFLSPSGLPQQMVIAWTIFWSFLSL